MKTHISWPHAPPHRLLEKGTYIVTCGTHQKQHILNTSQKLTLVRDLLFELANKYDWQLQAWAILSNHYHFVAGSPDDTTTLKKMLSTLHTLSARDINRIDNTQGRKVWYNYYDSRITYEKSWLARLKYVHHNPVHHGVVENAELYEWCSAAWFARESPNAFVKTVNSFKIDQVKVYDDFGVRQLDGALRSGSSMPEDMECGGSTPLLNTPAKQSNSALKRAHSKEASPQFKSAVTRSESEHLQDNPQDSKAVSSERTPKQLRCKYCNSTAIVKAGTRKLKSGIKQLYKCNDCLRKFSSLHRNAKQTDPEIILKSLIAACRSASYEEIRRFIERRYQRSISTSAISKWVKEYNPPYLKKRAKNNAVSKIVISNVFTHRDLNYNFQIHVPKLADCPLKELKEYLVKLPGSIDHHTFETASRCSQWLNPSLNINVKHSQNTQACKDALKALQFAKTNYQRHDVVEQFMLNCDCYTIASEVPVWMSLSECAGSTALSNTPAPQSSKSGVERLSRAFGPPHSETVSGHIDLLQWKFNTLYILDFKPNTRKENKQKVASQLSLYAMALSVRAGVPMDRMRCAWFDGEDFYSFKP